MPSRKLCEGHCAGTSHVARITHRPAKTATPRSNRGAELSTKSDTSPGKKSNAGKNKKHAVGGGGGGGDPGCGSTLYNHLHLGMKSNANATQLIQSWQGGRIALSMELLKFFVDRV